jgi:hypothetical protein
MRNAECGVRNGHIVSRCFSIGLRQIWQGIGYRRPGYEKRTDFNFVRALRRGCVKRIRIENITKFYFDFLGQDLPGFQNLEGLSARTKLKSVRFS